MLKLIVVRTAALLLAAYEGNLDAFEKLVKAGADLDEVDPGALLLYCSRTVE